jgi:hypothetical protein
VQVTDACGFTASDSIVLSADSPQGIDLGSDTAICNGQQILLDAGSGFSSYLWQDNSNAATYSVTVAGTYFVSALNAAGCSYADTITVTPCVAIFDTKPELALTVYPNPTDGSFSIDLGENYPTATVTLTDILGKTIQSKRYDNS